jgi:gas vesicle protein
MNSFLKSILKTAVYILDQADGATSDVRDRISDRVDRVSDRVSDLTDRGKELIYGEDHTMRNIGVFAAGLGVGVAAGILFAPASGEETRGSVRDKVEDISDRVRDRFAPSTKRRATGTEGGV